MARHRPRHRHAPGRWWRPCPPPRRPPRAAGRADGRPQGAAAGRQAARATGRAGARGADLVVDDGRGVPRVKGVSFDVRAGEIVGIAGVAGNGQSELLEALAGIRPLKSGQIRLRARRWPTPGRARRGGMRRLGLAHVPEDRQRVGLVKPFAAHENAILGYQTSPTTTAPIRLRRSAVAVELPTPGGRYDVRPPEPCPPHRRFSGGNQQKIVLAREIEQRPRPAAGRPADPRRRHRRHRVHPPAPDRDARRRQGAAAGLGRARRDPLAGRPHPRDVRRPHRRRAAPRPTPTSGRSAC